MKSKKTQLVAALVVGVLTGILGVVLIISYVSEAAVARAGEADQSLLFWYLPFLLLGIICLVSGLSITIWGVYRLKRIKRFPLTEK